MKTTPKARRDVEGSTWSRTVTLRWALGIAAALGAVGCASTGSLGQQGEADFSSATHHTFPSIRVGAAHAVRSPVDPQAHTPAVVFLEDGRFIVGWTRGDARSGHRALAQAFRPNGSPLGAPVVISPPDVDVLGAPSAGITDGHHVAMTFGTATGGSFEVLAAAIDDPATLDHPAPTGPSLAVARR